MRWLGIVVGSSFFAASACSLLLDTESLQKKGSVTGAGGSGGSAGAGGGNVDAGNVEAGKSCQTDFDCLPGLEIDGCTLYTCGADKTCQLPERNAGGLGVVSAGTVENLMTADDIGYPSLLADSGDIVMGVWHRTAGVTDVLVRKYPAYPQGGAGAELSAIAPGMFRNYGSSPGMIVRPTLPPRKVRLLLAADRLGDAGAGLGVRQVDIDVPTANNTLRLSAMQPVLSDLGIGGYDTRPRVFPPRLLPNGLQDPAGMWVQQQRLFYFNGTTAAEAFNTKRVLGFVPLAGSGVHAALETWDIGAAVGVEKTEIWSQGSPSLVSLDGDQLAPRRGVTATATNESGFTANLIAWSFEPRAGIPSMNYTAGLCSAASCSSVAFSMQPTAVQYAMFPELASARVTGSMVDRDVLQMFQISIPDPTQTTMATSVLFASVSRFTFPSADLTMSTSKTANPPVFPVEAASGPLSTPSNEVIGPTSVAITSDGQALAAWVVRPSATSAILRARRYQVRTCP